LAAPKPGEAHHGAQFPQLGALLLGNRNRGNRPRPPCDRPSPAARPR
jgi:hypothetical protein